MASELEKMLEQEQKEWDNKSKQEQDKILKNEDIKILGDRMEMESDKKEEK
jgi:hypothetical protein